MNEPRPNDDPPTTDDDDHDPVAAYVDGPHAVVSWRDAFQVNTTTEGTHA